MVLPMDVPRVVAALGGPSIPDGNVQVREAFVAIIP